MPSDRIAPLRAQPFLPPLHMWRLPHVACFFFRQIYRNGVQGLNPPLKISFNGSREGDGWSIQIAPMGSHLFSRDLISESLVLAEGLQERGDIKGSQLVAALVELIRNPCSQEEQS